MRTTPIVTVAAVVFALLIVAKSKTANLTEATQNPLQNTVSIYDLGASCTGRFFSPTRPKSVV